jgi:RNA polymerase sigma-70 factor, ECF subfamily
VDEDLALVEALRAGDETAFITLVDRYDAVMLRIARMYVPTQAIAEDVVADAWLGVLKGIAGFEGRSSLRTWILRIVTNIAKTRGQREARSAPFSSVWASDDDEPAVDPERFRGPHDRVAPGGWAAFPEPWETEPEGRLISNETLAKIVEAIEMLPPNQREVIRLRDVLGWSSDEVRNALDISETNQRVLLHRARSKVRRALEGYLAPEAAR